jgi:hypothetical protein
MGSFCRLGPGCRFGNQLRAGQQRTFPRRDTLDLDLQREGSPAHTDELEDLRD